MPYTGQDLADMIQRIDDTKLGREIKVYFQQSVSIEEVRSVMQGFLNFYIKRKD